MIKKLILIGATLMHTCIWADMDKVCHIDLLETENLNAAGEKWIREKCERNNILYVSGLGESYLTITQSYYCRFDRNVSKKIDNQGRYELTCVLYDNESRQEVDYK